MLVSEIRQHLDTRGEAFHTLPLSSVRVNEEGSLLLADHDPIHLDDLAIKTLSTFLGVPATYMAKCPETLIRENINYWLSEKKDSDANFHVMGSALRTVTNPNHKLIPVGSVFDILERNFSGNDEVKDFHVTDKITQVSVVSESTRIEVPSLGTELRPDNDLTYGGLRFLVHNDPTNPMPPSVESYMNRLVCTNGMARVEPEYKISLRGSTVDDILEELDQAASALMANLPNRLEQYRQSAEVPVPGNIAQFAYQVARERNLSSRVVDRVMQMVTGYGNTPSMYDMAQAFTVVAHEDITWRARNTLEYIGGDLTTDTTAMSHRCETCERTL